MPAAKPLFSDVLAVRGLVCARGGRVVFSGIDFDMRPGDAVVLAGANGSGKTSLLRIVAGALPAAAGGVFWNEKNISEKDSADYAACRAFLPPDDRHLKLLETVGESIFFRAAIDGVPHDAACRALDSVGLDCLRDAPVRILSSGQRRRLSIAFVLMRRHAPLWLLDEPFNALDDDAASAVHDALQEHRARGGMIVVAAHHGMQLADAKALTLSPEKAA